MKIPRFLCTLLFVASFAVRLLAGADTDFAALTALDQAKPPGTRKDMGAEPYARWIDEQNRKITAAALAFYEAHPADPRRWQAVMFAADSAPLFVQAFGPDFATKGMRDVTVDEAAKAAWQAKIDALRTALRDAADAPADLREGIEWMEFARDFRANSLAKSKGEPYDFEPFKARLAAHLAKFAGQPKLPDRAADYLGALERNVPGEGTAGWKRLAGTGDAGLRARAERELGKATRQAALATKPFELAFTAVDGRAVDMKNLRGKVVLLDFWATWCGPCIAELPNIKKVYADYHDKGFEIVGISLENAQLTGKETPAELAAKLEKAKKVLNDFTAKENMPWPQYFDGKHWKNDISTQYDIAGIPAMFLLDQEGKVVSTNARGEKLEAEVKRLLKL